MKKIPKSSPKNSGFVPVGQATGPTLEERSIKWVPWDKSARLWNVGDKELHWNIDMSNVEIDPAVVEAKEKSLPQMPRRTARQRAEVLATELFDVGLRSQIKFGYPVWPKSIQATLDKLGVKKNTLYEQVDALVGYFMLTTENEQKEQDLKSTVTAWHGHYD